MDQRTAIALINRKSGTVRSRGPEAVADLVREKLAPVFGVLEVKLFEGDITPHVKSVIGKFDIVVAGGGDGTIASAAAALLDTGVIMGALPLGTMNLFVQALGFSPKLEDALSQFASAHVSEIDVGLANDRVFLHQVSFGLQPRMAKLREKLGYRSRIGKMMGAARALVTLAARPKLVRINVELDGETLKVSSPMVAITNNPIGSDKHWSVQHRLDGGVLGYYALSDTSLRALLRLARGYLRNRLHDDEIVDNRTAHEVLIKRRPRKINFKRRKGILASMDGEVVVLNNPVQISMKRAALKVLEV
jgi:diacylglycerol kinase family enzyme